MIPLPAIKRLALGCMGHEQQAKEWSSRKGIFNFANVNLALNLVHCKGQRFWNFMPDLLHYLSASQKDIVKSKIQHHSLKDRWLDALKYLKYYTKRLEMKYQILWGDKIQNISWEPATQILFNPSSTSWQKATFFEYNMCRTSANLPLNSIRGILSARVNLNGKKSTYTCCWAMICRSSSKCNLKSFGSFGK